MPAPVRDPNPRMPYQLPMPTEASADLVIGSVLPDDDRVWVPQAPTSGSARSASMSRRAIGSTSSRSRAPASSRATATPTRSTATC